MNGHRATAALLATLALPAATVCAEDGSPEAGRLVYEAKLCNLCHIVAGVSGPMANLGGSLDGVGQRRDAAWLALYFTDPKAAIPNATMPAANLTKQELADLVAYLLTLR
ncbi:c-type cytochrome [Thiocapsa rosea]|uniref:Nitric oxide reductase subunit C n=1 Tax=Thiocapsa rosea TaxID=69360 RepID=A0A495V7I7_9GAMM|nr:cytochrome c [Thiocapsa rosea]RKT43728.1 nitric oxide reductase subunit C [Thiocapsa rosea]